jgi:N-carbamoylputrescine amidase
MKIGLIPAKCVNGDIKHNANQIVKFIKIAAKSNIEYIFFGESFLQGFNSLNWDFTHDIKIASDKEDKAIINILNTAKQYNIGVGFGYFELANDAIYSSYLVASNDDAQTVNYRRLSKGWKESSITDQHYREGKQVEQFYIKGRKFTIALCGDLWDEETINLFSSNEVYKSIIIWPVHVDFSLEEWNKELSNYHEQSLKFSKQVLMINNIMQPSTHGGAFEFQEDNINSVEFGKEDILVIEI